MELNDRERELSLKQCLTSIRSAKTEAFHLLVLDWGQPGQNGCHSALAVKHLYLHGRNDLTWQALVIFRASGDSPLEGRKYSSHHRELQSAERWLPCAGCEYSLRQACPAGQKPGQ